MITPGALVCLFINFRGLVILDAAGLFARNFVEVGFSDFSGVLIDEAKKQVLDLFACAIGGYGQSGAVETRELAIEWGGAEQSTIFGCGVKVPAPAAAQVNASMVHSLDFDDVHEAAIMPVLKMP